MEENKLYSCNEAQFYEFLKNRNLKEVQGEIFHSSYYVDGDGNKLAYRETSSWTSDVCYKIASGNANFEAINLVNNLLNGDI